MPETEALLGLPASRFDPETPPHYDPDQRSWHVYRYADVRWALSDMTMFSQQLFPPESREVHPNYAMMWAADDPRHSDLRALQVDWFRPKDLQQLRPIIAAIANALVDDILTPGRDHFEIVSQFAYLLPNRVICHLLEVPLEGDTRFAAWLREANSAGLHDMPTQPDMISYFAGLLDERRRALDHGARPTGIDSLLVASQNGHQVAGAPLSEWDMIASLWGLLSAGNDTTCTSIATMLVLLGSHGHLERLRQNPQSRPTAIEETLRWCPAFPAISVICRSGVTLSGSHVGAGELVTCWISAANRDPRKFDEPDVFDAGRSPNPHLTFVRGSPYACLGAALARLELAASLDVLLDRLPGLRWDPARPFRRTSARVNHVAEAWFTF